MPSTYSPRLKIVGVAVVLAAVAFCCFVWMWGESISWRLNTMLGRSFIGVYDDCTISARDARVFAFTTGIQGRVASFRLKTEDGRIFELTNMSQNTAAELLSSEEHYIAEGQKRTCFSDGSTLYSSAIFFADGKLTVLYIHSKSNIRVDFGDGEFVELPVDLAHVTKIIGKPNRWSAEKVLFH